MSNGTDILRNFQAAEMREGNSEETHGAKITLLSPPGIALNEYGSRYRVTDESAFCSWLQKKYELHLCGSLYDSSNGELTARDVRGIIQQEISPFIKTGLDKIVSALERTLRNVCPKKTKPLATYSLEKLEEENVAPPSFVVNDLLPIGLTFLVSPPKTGKSWLAADLGDSIVHGTPFLGKPTAQGGCLYLDLESSKQRTKARNFEKLRLQPSPDFIIAHEAETLDGGLLEQLEMFAQEHSNLKLVIIDTLARVKGQTPRNGNAYEVDTLLLAPLQRFALDRGIAILIISHLRKVNGFKPDDPFERIVGSGGQFGVSDGAWLIDGARSENEKTLYAVGRDFEYSELSISFDSETCRWKCNGSAEEVQERREYEGFENDSLVITIKHLVNQNGGRWAGTAESLMEELKSRTADSSLNTPRAVSSHIHEIQEKLSLFEDIYYKPPNPNGGRQGRVHTFYKHFRKMK